MGALLGKGVWNAVWKTRRDYIQADIFSCSWWETPHGNLGDTADHKLSKSHSCASAKKKQSYCNVYARTACKEQELIFQFCLAVVKIELECCIHLGHQISKHELSEKSLRKSSISFWKEIRNLECMTCEERFSELELIRLKKRKFRMGTITDFARLSPTNKEGCSVYLQQVG